MKLPEGDRLQDAIDLFHDDSWACPGGKPDVSTEQLAYWLAVLEPWYRQEFTPHPNVSQRPKPATDKGSQHRGRSLVYGRSGGLCEVASVVCVGQAREWQHRRNRSQSGTWYASNGLHACSPCHQWIHANPQKARSFGWTVWSHEDPTVVPVLRRGVLVLLDDEGGFEPVEREAA